MALTVDQLTTQMVNQLRLLDPTVSAEVGTPERKIIEAVAELIASQQVDFTVLNQQTDLSSMSSGRLDAYLSIFNFGRQQAVPSYGTVTFSTNTPVTQQITIPLGTQVIANINDPVFPSLTFVTTQAVILAVGQTSVDAPVQCTVAGSVGNIDANTIVGFASLQSIQGISSISNAAAMTGGADQEDDAAYKTRFQNTFLRNISGTDDMFLALSVAQNGVTKANVVGPISRYQEYMQVPTSDDEAQVSTYDPNGIQATVTLTSDNVNPADGDTLTLHDVTYRFKGTPAQINDIQIAGAATTTMLNLIGAVNQTGSTGNYPGTVAPTDVAAGTYNSTTHQVTFNSITYSSAANSYASTETSSHLSFSSATFVGGVDAIWTHKRTTAESSNPYTKFTYPLNYYVTDGTLDPATAQFYKPGVDYIFNSPPIISFPAPSYTTDSAHPYNPNITFLDISASGISGGDTVLMEHAYISINSRNNYSYGILNCVDVFINGENAQAASSEEIVPTSSNALQNSNALVWTYQKTTATEVINFRRDVDGRPSAVGSLIQPLYWQPVLDLPETIEVGTATYYKANYYNPGDSTYYNDAAFTTKAHYCLANEVNSYFGTIRSRSGIEWFQSGNNHLDGELASDPADHSSYSGPKIEAQVGTQFTVDSYLYDQNISDLQAVMEANRQTTQDVLVHKAKERYFQPIVTIMYSIGATKAVVNASIQAALSSFFENQYYGAAIQLSDILQVIHNVPGVDNVRWSNPDVDGDKVQEVSADGYPLSDGVVMYQVDFFIQDNELAASPNAPVVTVANGRVSSISDGTTPASIFISYRAQNTFSLS